MSRHEFLVDARGGRGRCEKEKINTQVNYVLKDNDMNINEIDNYYMCYTIITL